MSEMNCDLCRQWMTGYLDNELDASTQQQFTEHLMQCADCQQRLEALSLLSAAVKTHLPYFTAPTSLTHSLRSRLETAAMIQDDFWHRLRLWIAPALSAAFFAAALFLYVTTPSIEDSWTDEAVSSHVRSLMGEHLMDVASSDKHTVKPWFTGKLDFSPPVYDFSAQGFPLLGGRLDYLQHQTAAALTYRHDKHIINTFVVPTAEADRPPHTQTRRGYNIVSWRQNHMRFIIVSDLDKGELETFSQLTRTGL
ncbi:zf-HC2 domain-containing protein [Pseudomonas sp. CCI3.2]|uniref:anti-sigma factor family protein n=1 Tax=unclassified Pseudomonas TaxID=196821 RepID=UPI002AC89BA2|nr:MULTISPECIES: zf-HC2 domain-containing protein [unclassified Pseudomonas]MEB0079386.1 zf-HC2 domain-containing protein [Pseudomonas sp. MH10out]MEB0104289.1 zf-HC2 domain-containing protein [Pseudomonas sp. CCI3.2]MEB0132415.1 zf-HC2 domain-containing protein [Pseudomonas sp. CCI2.4]MEB0159697.1 zf-HC2 domain-containing protein [Pseudomonas sp. AH2 (2023)]MEB0169095.1 zf-HC2 domain-containing protein [Pseudomonas sp. CCC4.4]